MSRRYPLLILVTLILILGSAFTIFSNFSPSGLPFGVRLLNAHTAAVEPFAGVPQPPGLHVGDRIDLSASGRAARIALLPSILSESNLSGVQTYTYTLRKDHAFIAVPVTPVNILVAGGVRVLLWLAASYTALFAAVALLLLWRGRDRTSANMMLWVMTVWIGNIFTSTPTSGNALLAFQLLSNVSFLLARVGFYFTIERMLSAALTSGRRALFRGIFLLVLLAGAFQQLGGVLIFVTSGWVELLRPIYGLTFSAGYLVPVVMLFMSYRLADAAQRLRLRWILWSSVIWVLAIMLSNTPVLWLGRVAANSVYVFGFVVALGGFLYAVLRHRVVNVSVVLDRTLVYGSVTALVVGVLAAVQSVVQHTALGTSASLLLQIVVPLALGIVLSQVRKYADKIVERLFFRKRYLAEKALRSFARSAGGYDRAEALRAATVQTVHDKLNAPCVVVYVRTGDRYIATNHAGGTDYPEAIAGDDNALAAARAGQKDIDLSELHSALGKDGYIFAMGQQGVLVCANRPGEHHSADERKLLAYVARQVGMALYALRVQETLRRLQAKSGLVDAVLAGTLSTPAEITAKARELAPLSAAS